MKRICCLGTCVGPDALRLIKNPEWKLAKAYISYSLSAVLHMSGADVRKLQSNPFVEEKYNVGDLFSEINGEILTKLKEENFDLLLVDLCDFRLAEYIIELENGMKLFLSKRAYSESTLAGIRECIEKTYQSKVKAISTHSPFADPYEQTAAEMISFAELMYKTFGRAKVLFFCSRPIVQYLDNGQIMRMANYKIMGDLNDRIENILNCLPHDFEYMRYPDNLIGDRSWLSVFEFHFCRPYYEYLLKAAKIKLEFGSFGKERADLLKKKCEEEIADLYGEVFCRSLLLRLKPRLADKGLKLVLLARSGLFGEMLKKEYGREIFAHITYDRDADLGEIAQSVRKLKEEAPDCLFVVPELYYHGQGKGLSRLFYDEGCAEWKDYIVYAVPSFTLAGFSGHYRDIFNNEIHSRSVLNITVSGSACKVDIESNTVKNMKIIVESNSSAFISKGCRGHDGIIQVARCAQLFIGERSSFGDAHIACHTFTALSIGKDCLFSWGEMLFSGDGHAIFALSAQKEKSVRVNPNERDSLVVGDHVWLGYRCHILSGANIGSGSIVGAGSVVNKKFPNNCILAGVPARIVKKDRAWCANPFYTDLKSDKPVFENYADLTVEDQNE